MSDKRHLSASHEVERISRFDIEKDILRLVEKSERHDRKSYIYAAIVCRIVIHAKDINIGIEDIIGVEGKYAKSVARLIYARSFGPKPSDVLKKMSRRDQKRVHNVLADFGDQLRQ